LRGVTTLTGKTQFGLVYEKGGSWVTKEIIIRALPNKLESSRYGITVSRRVGKAVVRNKTKRRLREILRQVDLQPGWDLIIIARNPAVKVDFLTLRNSVRELLVRAGLFVGEHEGSGS
jgi:ribonuclease P protein component